MTGLHTAALLDDRPRDGVFRVHREAFVRRDLFDLEMEHIFGKTWIFLGLESQVPQANDFFTWSIGQTPVLVTRDRSGAVRGFINACRHKGAKLCDLDHGNTRVHVCPYHGWAYDAAGRCTSIKNRDASGCYGASFDNENHDLLPLPAFDSYRGLLFGSLSPEVPPLRQYLGQMAPLLDLVLDQGPQGMEFVPGKSTYTFKGNWKLQMDNGLDFYHLTSAHVSYLQVVARRHAQRAGNQAANSVDWQRRLRQESGMFGFEHGHVGLWMHQPQPEKRPIHAAIDEIRNRVGATRADWMLRPRQYLIFPNLQIADSSTTVLRTFRPLAPDLTEMRVHCFAPVGEAPSSRAMRIRQFEDFFSASGLATPDDSVLYERCHAGLQSGVLEWLQGYMRGLDLQVRGASAEAREIGIEPSISLTGGFDVQNEVAFHPAFREWHRLLEAGIAGNVAVPSAQRSAFA